MRGRWAGRLGRAVASFAEAVARWRPSGDPTAPGDLAWRIVLLVVLAGMTLALFPPRRGVDVPVVRAGTVAPEDVIAPFDYQVPLGEEELAARREQAALTVPPVYSAVPAAPDSAVARLEAYLERVAAAGDADAEDLAALNRVDGRSMGLRPGDLRELFRPDTREALLAFARQAYPILYEQGWVLPVEELAAIPSAQLAVVRPDGTEVLVPRSEVLALRPGGEIPALARLAREVDPAVERIALQLLPALAPANLTARPALTSIRRQEAREAVDPVAGEVLSGELVVAARTRVTSDQEAKVRALSAELARRRGGVTPEDIRVAIGMLVLNAALLFLFGFYLFLYRRDLFDDLRALAALGIVWGLTTGLAAVVERVEGLPPYVAPVALASLLAAVLWDTRLSAVTTLFLAVFLASQGELGFPVLWTGLLGGLAGGWSVRRIRRRTHFYESLVFVMAGHALAIGAIGLIRLWGWGDFGVGLVWGFLSAALAVFLAMGLMPLLEWVSGRTTDLTLLELADLNRPLLKRLLVEAPGTYHHSIIVGNLAESAAEGIGANSLLARVGAYYHDIGKVERPEFFAENQRRGTNPHDGLDARTSARIVARHVDDGVALARRSGLPEVVVDFIREHHGTCRLAYFWHKAAEEDPAAVLAEEEFRYPGPRPGSKETAVVMLADSVEAASRSLADPSPTRFRQAVQRIVAMKLEERQLERTGLTFHDLATVEEKFVAVLSGIHHHRIEYPGVSLGPEEEAKDESAGPLPRVRRTPS